MGRLGAWVSLLVAAAIGLSLAAPGFAAAPGSSVEIAGESTAAGSLPPLQPAPVKGKPTESTLQVPLVVRRPGLLRIEYIAAATGTHLRVGRHSSTFGLSVTAPALPRRELRPGEVLVLGLNFKVSAGHEDELPGVISLGTAPALPLVRQVEAPAESGGLALTQKKVEISATRLIPFVGTPEASASVGVVGTPEAKSPEPLGSSYLTFDHGGHAAVAVAKPSKKGSVQTSRISVTEASGVGTASTVVDLGGHEKASQQLEVVVTVGDSLLAPFLVVLIGALLGKLVPTLLDTKRQRELVEKALLEAQEEYDKALAEAKEWKATKKVELPTFDPKLGLGGGPDDSPPEISAEGEGKLAGLVSRLDSFRRPSKFEEDSEEAEALINALKGWVVVVEAMQLLAEELGSTPAAALGDDSKQQPIAAVMDGEILLGQGFEIGPDLSRWTDLAAAIHGQALVLEVWNEVMNKRASAGSSDPSPGAAAYEAAKPPLVRSPAETETLLAALRKELFTLETQPKLEDQPQFFSANIETAVHIQRPFGPGTPLVHLAAIARPKKARTPASIMASVRRGDWLLAFAAFLISSLVYLLPVYGSGPFGTWQQYLGAFVAGAGGQVTVSTVIPWTRSYKLSPTGQASAPPAATS